MRKAEPLRIDPVYLRQILTGLGDGNVTSDISSLPFGVESVFERSVSEWPGIAGHPIDVLRAYALLRDPLGMADVAFLLDLESDDIHAAIRDNAHLFNGTSATGYVLFHDRFRTHILAGSSSHELKDILNRLHVKLEGALRSTGPTRNALREYAFQHLWAHAICSDADPADLLALLLEDTIIQSFEADTRDGWLKIRNHFHQLRIRQRYAEPRTILDLCMAEIELSQRYQGKDVAQSFDGDSLLVLDHLHDHIGPALLTLAHLRSGDLDQSQAEFQRLLALFKSVYGRRATLGALTGFEESPGEDLATHTLPLILLEEAARHCALQGHDTFALELVEFIDASAWFQAIRNMMHAYCQIGEDQKGMDLLKWIAAGHDGPNRWNPEEVHPIEIAGEMGRADIVFCGEALPDNPDYYISGLQKLCVFAIRRQEDALFKRAFNRFTSALRSKRSPIETHELILFAGVLAQMQQPHPRLNGILDQIEARILSQNLNEEDQGFYAHWIQTELAQAPQTQDWAIGVLDELPAKAKGFLPFTVCHDADYIETKRRLETNFSGLFGQDPHSICPTDWTHRTLCGEKAPSLSFIRLGLTLEWHARRDAGIQACLGLEA